MGNWSVTWGDGDRVTYRIQLKNEAVHMSVLSCTARSKYTCASPKEAVVTPTTNDEYVGWMQARDVHGGKVTIYIKKVDSGLRLVWKRPGGKGTEGIGKIMPGKYDSV